VLGNGGSEAANVLEQVEAQVKTLGSEHGEAL